MTLQHIVLFSFPRQLSTAEARDMRDQVASWATEIATMGALRFGTDLTGARNRGYQYLLYMEFANGDDLLAYQAHPVHQRFLAWITERDCTPLAFDYHLDTTTVLVPEPALTPKEPT